ncbi:rhodanese-like domain-containing protein [Anaerobacillus sp. 1_MG-2023]|uniref:MBL fold metallo-hydrolase n=1 Tax=Anaerobacillus sp. 1_MG-2023 TaxID=3062655 RepID=UPI0026E3B613|nr:rhodanese-like domain-containing protein [Anaerobacillus sp. 1_MG-2023]MDO6654881.1 rhodanese-like domain-containing protein [Anaerobacillus sp. 1_MG-2023]
MYLRTFFDEKLAQYSYMIGCQRTGEALVIDPARDVTPYLETAKKEGFHLVAAAETHIHADFVSGARQLAEKHDVKLYLSDEGDQDWKYGYLEGLNVELVTDGSIISVGNVELRVMHTPGHTPESISFELTDRGGGSEVPMGIFTGDFVFVGDIGRPDLLEKAAGAVGTAETGAKAMFQSLQKFKELPEYLTVWPGHGAGSACGKSLGAVPQSTVGYELRNNWALKEENEGEFVKELLNEQPEAPTYFAVMKKVNKEGPNVLSGEELEKIMNVDEFRALARKDNTTIVDTRPAQDFAEGHIDGAINLPFNKAFTNWSGWVLDYDHDLLLIADDEQKDEIVKAFHSIGIDHIRGYASPELLSQWDDLEGYSFISTEQLNDVYDKEDVYVVDIRKENEWNAGHIPGANHHMLGYLEEQANDIPEDKTIVVHCQSGTRSAIGTSLLQSLGFKDILNYSGGFAAWEKDGDKIEK